MRKINNMPDIIKSIHYSPRIVSKLMVKDSLNMGLGGQTFGFQNLQLGTP